MTNEIGSISLTRRFSEVSKTIAGQNRFSGL